ncbi:Dihydrodipicolinate synthetase-like protein [Macrophomina phaseolina MS6]|uniref:Dihydrodipicolinate synthetase-like protein n=1 Tax=Macrophomina phaseolina (strain MS6) TaxID=1126212 RepID=K2SIR3_MACPH|nr:Dihydrodipicolinate synthetase-like protein [Macrophomina phaseolina MS6]
MSPHQDAPSPQGFSMSSGAVQDSVNITNNTGRRPMPPGVYVPTPAFFDPVSEDVDLETTASHAVRLAQAGVAGITTQGSNGEAVCLTHKERNLITSTTRAALDAAGFTSMPIIVGCGAQSTRETIELCFEAHAAGGDYALVLPPAYYQGLFNADTIAAFFRDVASASPIPILIYNYPGAVSGLDLNSDAIVALASHPNIVGCKLTCGNTGKLARVAAATRAATPSENGSGFLCMGGSADFTLQTLIAGGSGIIAGLANIAPKACVRLVELFESGNLKAARELQAVVARGDWAAIRGGVVSTKSALMSFWGYGGYARKPLPRPGKEESLRWRQGFEELVAAEKAL